MYYRNCIHTCTSRCSNLIISIWNDFYCLYEVLQRYILSDQAQRKLDFEMENKRKMEQVVKDRERQLDMEMARNRESEANKANSNERVALLEKQVRFLSYFLYFLRPETITRP